MTYWCVHPAVRLTVGICAKHTKLDGDSPAIAIVQRAPRFVG